MLPNQGGVWLHIPTQQNIEIYDLEPVGCWCLWGPDIGMTYSAATETQECWTSDEWQGHIPVHSYDDDAGSWSLIKTQQRTQGEKMTDKQHSIDKQKLIEQLEQYCDEYSMSYDTAHKAKLLLQALKDDDDD